MCRREIGSTATSVTCSKKVGIPTSPRAASLRKDDFLSPDESLVTPEQVAAAHHAGLKVVPYTSNDAAGWKKLADAHVDAIITDDPAGLLPWLRSQQPPLHP
jgi:glycerophosphoryl diester phosphodiesterase